MGIESGSEIMSPRPLIFHVSFQDRKEVEKSRIQGFAVYVTKSMIKMFQGKSGSKKISRKCLDYRNENT